MNDKLRNSFLIENAFFFSEWMEAKSKPLYTFWAILVFVSWLVMIYHTMVVWSHYYSHPTATQQFIETQPRYDFPPVLFCPSKRVNESKANYMNLSESVLQYSLSLLPDVLVNYNYSLPLHRAKNELLSNLTVPNCNLIFCPFRSMASKFYHAHCAKNDHLEKGSQHTAFATILSIHRLKVRL